MAADRRFGSGGGPKRVRVLSAPQFNGFVAARWCGTALATMLAATSQAAAHGGGT